MRSLKQKIQDKPAAPINEHKEIIVVEKLENQLNIDGRQITFACRRNRPRRKIRTKTINGWEQS
jgi:hypothetical protein